MSRRSKLTKARIIVFAILIGLAVGAGSLAPHRAIAAGAVTFTVTLAPLEPRCDGDSVRLTVRAVTDEGLPATELPVGLFTARDGDQVALPGGVRASQVNGETNARGVFRAYITPAPGTKTRYHFALGGVGNSALRTGACPLAADRSFVVDATMFRDTNGDGAQGPRERQIKDGRMAIYGLCTIGCQYPLHYDRAGRDGVFEWTGLIQYPLQTLPSIFNVQFPDWRICVPDDHRASTITSINGVVVDPLSVTHFSDLACTHIDPLLPGVNNLKVGVR